MFYMSFVNILMYMLGFRKKVFRFGDYIYCKMKKPEVLEVRKFLSESQWWDRDRLEEYRDRRIDRMTTHAYETVPYYREVMDENGIEPEDIRSTDDLTEMPILERDVVQERFDDLLSHEFDPSSVNTQSTGGTTGEPVKVAIDKYHQAFANESQWRGFGFAGYTRGDPLVRLTGGSIIKPSDDSALKKLRTALSGETFLPAFELSDENVHEYVDAIQESNAQYVRGYSSTIYQLSDLIREHGYHVRVGGVFPTADIMHDHQRKVVEEHLGEVFAYYTAMEARAMAYECPEERDYHVSDEHVFIEALDGDERVSDGEVGGFAITTLQNHAMPLIRYRNGDAGVLKTDPCSCGRGLSKISELHGRTTDFLKATDGRLVSGLFIPHVFRKTKTIKRIQIRQETETELRILVVRGEPFDASELDHILQVISEYLGKIEIDVEFVDSIPTSSSEKRRFVVSEVADEASGFRTVD